jgi:hypothetical protein
MVGVGGGRWDKYKQIDSRSTILGLTEPALVMGEPVNPNALSIGGPVNPNMLRIWENLLILIYSMGRPINPNMLCTREPVNPNTVREDYALYWRTY